MSALWLVACAGDGPPERGSETSPDPARHAVATGESVCSLAGRYGVDPAALRSTNGLPERGEVTPGASLELPEGPPLTYTIRPGDSLSRIAQWTGLTIDALAEANQLANADRIRVGTVLRLPAGAKTGCPPPARRRTVAERPSPVPDPVSDGMPAQAAPTEPDAATQTANDDASEKLAATPNAASAAGPKGSGTADTELAPVVRLAEARLVLAEHYYEAGDYTRALTEADAIATWTPVGASDGAAADGAGDERLRGLRGQAEILAGLSQIGLGDAAAAAARFAAAQHLDPTAALDPQQHSPKVLELWNGARGSN